MPQLLIKNASAIVTCDDADHVLRNTDILIRDGEISEIGMVQSTSSASVD